MGGLFREDNEETEPQTKAFPADVNDKVKESFSEYPAERTVERASICLTIISASMNRNIVR